MLEELLKYQEMDARLHDIELSLSKSEERKKAVSAKKYLDGVEESFNKLVFKATELLAMYDKITNETNKLRGQEAEVRSALETVSSEKEASYLIKKIDELLAQLKNLSTTADKMSENIQGVLVDYNGLKSNTKTAQTQYKENKTKYAELKKSFKTEMEQIVAELSQIKQNVNPKFMEKYLAKRDSKMYPVVYEVKGDTCGFCNMQLAMNEINKLKNGEIVECDHCGRLLYSK